MIVTNGDGRGTDEVRSYKIFLNGDRVSFNQSQQGSSPVKVKRDNILKVTLSGGPHSKVSVLIAYDPQQHE